MLAAHPQQQQLQYQQLWCSDPHDLEPGMIWNLLGTDVGSPLCLLTGQDIPVRVAGACCEVTHWHSSSLRHLGVSSSVDRRRNIAKLWWEEGKGGKGRMKTSWKTLTQVWREASFRGWWQATQRFWLELASLLKVEHRWLNQKTQTSWTKSYRVINLSSVSVECTRNTRGRFACSSAWSFSCSSLDLFSPSLYLGGIGRWFY